MGIKTQITGEICTDTYLKLIRIIERKGIKVSKSELVSLLVKHYINNNKNNDDVYGNLKPNEIDSVEGFFNTRISDLDDKHRKSQEASLFYRAYVEYCTNEKVRPIGRRKFYSSFTEKGYILKNSTGNNLFVYGCEIIDEEEEWL